MIESSIKPTQFDFSQPLFSNHISSDAAEYSKENTIKRLREFITSSPTNTTNISAPHLYSPRITPRLQSFFKSKIDFLDPAQNSTPNPIDFSVFKSLKRKDHPPSPSPSPLPHKKMEVTPPSNC